MVAGTADGDGAAPVFLASPPERSSEAHSLLRTIRIMDIAITVRRTTAMAGIVHIGDTGTGDTGTGDTGTGVTGIGDTGTGVTGIGVTGIGVTGIGVGIGRFTPVIQSGIGAEDLPEQLVLATKSADPALARLAVTPACN